MYLVERGKSIRILVKTFWNAATWKTDRKIN
jgi:hypothetical protein